MDKDQITRQVKKLIPSLELLYLFGSCAKSQARSESDVDLAFSTKVEIEPTTLYHITQELSSLYNRDVDLIDLRKASTVFKVEILQDGILLYAESDALRNCFEMYALADYVHLNYERRELLSDFYSSENPE